MCDRDADVHSDHLLAPLSTEASFGDSLNRTYYSFAPPLTPSLSCIWQIVNTSPAAQALDAAATNTRSVTIKTNQSLDHMSDESTSSGNVIVSKVNTPTIFDKKYLRALKITNKR